MQMVVRSTCEEGEAFIRIAHRAPQNVARWVPRFHQKRQVVFGYEHAIPAPSLLARSRTLDTGRAPVEVMKTQTRRAPVLRHRGPLRVFVFRSPYVEVR